MHKLFMLMKKFQAIPSLQREPAFKDKSEPTEYDLPAGGPVVVLLAVLGVFREVTVEICLRLALVRTHLRTAIPQNHLAGLHL